MVSEVSILELSLWHLQSLNQERREGTAHLILARFLTHLYPTPFSNHPQRSTRLGQFWQDESEMLRRRRFRVLIATDDYTKGLAFCAAAPTFARQAAPRCPHASPLPTAPDRGTSLSRRRSWPPKELLLPHLHSSQEEPPELSWSQAFSALGVHTPPPSTRSPT